MKLYNESYFPVPKIKKYAILLGCEGQLQSECVLKGVCNTGATKGDNVGIYSGYTQDRGLTIWKVI